MVYINGIKASRADLARLLEDIASGKTFEFFPNI